MSIAILLGANGFSEKADLEILKRALEKGLGEKTNIGMPRILTLERSVVRGEDNLLVSIQANHHLMSAGVRNGVLKDVADILRIAKSWGWAAKIDHILIFGNQPLKNMQQTRPLFSCSVAAQTIAEVKWESICVREIQQYLENPVFYEVEE